MGEILNIGNILMLVFLIFATFLMVSYVILACLSFYSSDKYKRRNQFVDYKDILTSDEAPSVSLLAPAYNEGMTIIENVRSLLSIQYTVFEVLIVNDGSKDDTLQKLILEYDLELVDFAVEYKLETKKVRGVYKSKNKAFSHLTIVDKENGGKADALNVGINVCQNDYVACIDVDCVLESDAILKLMKPFLEETNEEVIATGGVIRIANSCTIEDGKLIKIDVPENMIARIQVLEYFRAFLLGRMAWSEMNALLLISGALGVFKKSIAVAAGGYDHKTVGEDMELVVRMRKYMHENDRPYRVDFIPDPLCWTEAPDYWALLIKQRNRWTRGTIETLLWHRNICFNKKYGIIGMVSYPYWLLFEWAAPILEAIGLVVTLVMAIFGMLNWLHFGLMLLFIYSFAVIFSVSALLIEELSYHQYRSHKQIFKLMIAGLVEPIYYHPIMVYAAIRGNIDFLTGKSSWGEMTRKGFDKKEDK